MTERAPATAWAGLVLAYRERQGWTQARMAERFNVSRRTVIRWEMGDVVPGAAEQELLRGEINKAA